MVRHDGYPRLSDPACMAKLQMGIVVGLALGVGSAMITGSASALRYGYRGLEFSQQVVKHVGINSVTSVALCSTFQAFRC